jgi:hypothetical protein
MKADTHNHGSARKPIKNTLGVRSGHDEVCAGPHNIDTTVGHNPYPFALRFAEIVHPDTTNMFSE